MRTFVCLCLSFLGNISAVLAAVASDGLLARSDRNSVVVDSTVEKRAGNARLTFYDTGLGACGKYNNPGDFIVALNAPQWDGGSHCFQTITITYGGKTAQAQIVDQCPGCPLDALDLSAGLFSYFSDLGAGVIYGDWHYGSAAPPPPPPTTHTTSPAARTTSSTSAPISAHHSSSLTSSTTSSTTITSSVAATPTPTGFQILNNLQLALIGLGGIIVAGANIQG